MIEKIKDTIALNISAIIIFGSIYFCIIKIQQDIFYVYLIAFCLGAIISLWSFSKMEI